MIVQVVMFKSSLSDKDVRRTIEDRAPQYRALPGLLQKLYVKDEETGEYGGIYVWRDEESLQEFRQSELAKTIPEAYKVEGQARRETVEVIYVLREDVGLKAAA
jgi:heme-degrading monooxygenase HmoA